MQLLVIFRKSPFARLLFFYMAGILLAVIFNVRNSVFLLVLTFTTILLAATLLLVIRNRPGYNTDWISGLISGIILLSSGFINMNVQQPASKRYSEADRIKGTYVMEIADPPAVRATTVKATAFVDGYMADCVWKNDRQKILVYIEKDTASVRLVPGDRIIAGSTLYQISPPKNPGEFDYRKYLAARHIYSQMYLKSGSWKPAGICDRNSLQILAFRMQAKLISNYQKIGMNNTLYSLLSALTLGYKNDLESHTKQVFSQAGVMHVMALSGFNVAVIALAMGYLLFFFNGSFLGRLSKTILIILLIWLFAFITGLSPSVTRAAVMISFVMTGKLLHRHINTYNILFASAFFLLTLSPELISDVSFQLSFAAVLGIVIYQPVLSRILVVKNRIADKIWQLFTLSCAAQLGTLPFTLYYFHQFPVYFWLTNLYVVPLVSMIICVAGIFLLFSAVDPLMLVLGKLLAFLLAVLYKSVAFIEILPYSLIENIHMSGLQVTVLVIFILSLGWLSVTRKPASIWLPLILLIAFQLTNTVHSFMIRDQKLFIVGNVRGTTAINVISGLDCILLSDSTLYPGDQMLQYAFRNFWTEKGIAGQIKTIEFNDLKHADSILDPVFRFPGKGNNIVFSFSGKRIAVLTDDSIYKLQSGYPLKTNMIVVTEELSADLNSIIKLLNPELLIIDSSVMNYQAVQWIKSCQQLGIKYWCVQKAGAYMLTIK